MADVAFVGVTTGSSLARRALGCWRPLLGVDCGLRGIDIAVDAADDAYAVLLDQLGGDPAVLGAVVTTHKLRMFQAGRARFGRLDPIAVACEEINAIKRHDDGSLEGWARDPVSVGRVVDRIWPARGTGHVVCLGAGGTAVALAHHLFSTRPPVRFVCADPDANAAARVARIARHPVVSHLGSGPWDHLLAEAPPGSLIVNATGLGKDRPGSPITGRAPFPPGATVWELNYRGQLAFLDHARRQAEQRQLRIHDGWDLFCHGWAAALTPVLDLPDDPDLGDRFAAAAQLLRPTG
jgi:shikimate dehydrogenase